MKKIRLKRQNDIADYHASDVDRIVRVLADHGFDATPEQAYELWQQHSESFAAGWMYLPVDDSELFESIDNLFEVVDGE